MSAQSLPITAQTEIATTSHFELGYRPALDGVRGIAILAVLAVHTNHLFGWSLLQGGSIGVDIFFVLSGFLITSILLAEWTATANINLKHFYARRFLRLVPALLLLCVVLLPLSGLLFSPAEAEQTRRTIPIALLYLTDFFASLAPQTSLGVLRHTWSLAIEEHFYLLWPPVLLFLLKSGISRRGVLLLTTSLAVAVCLHRALLFEPGVAAARTYYAFDTRADSLLIGCAAGIAVSWGFVKSFKRVNTLAITLILVCLLATDFAAAKMHKGGFTILAGATALLLINLVLAESKGFNRVMESRPLVWIGKISYGLYLWHYPVFKWINHASAPWPVKLALALCGTFAVASVSFYLLERPLLQLKKRFA